MIIARASRPRTARIAFVATSTAVALTLPGCAQLGSFGSWTQVVKVTEVGVYDDDADETVRVLEETNQSFIIYNIDSEAEWAGFNDLLYAVGSRDIDVFAAVDAPHLDHAQTRLFELAGITEPDCNCADVTGAYLTGTDLYDCKRECIRAWLQAWIAAARQLSDTAAMYSCLKGFVINDFDMYVESIDYPKCRIGDLLDRGEIQQILDALRSNDPDLEFWPVCYPGAFGRVIGDGYVLGANYGVKVFPGDRMSVVFTFSVTDAPSIAQLRFLHRDTITTEDGISDCELYAISKQLLVNDNLVWSESVAGEQFVQRCDRDIAGLLKAGENTVELRLQSDVATAANGCDELFWRCWDVSLELTTASDTDPYFTSEFATLSPSYSVESDDTQYEINTGCYGSWLASDFTTLEDGRQVVSNDGNRCNFGLPHSATAGRGAKRLIAAPSTDYLIHDLVDGIVMPWYGTERPSLGKLITDACSQGPVWPIDGDIETFRAVLTRAALDVEPWGLMVLHRGIPETGSEFNLDVQKEQLETAADIALYVGLWNMANGLHVLDTNGGVFAERDRFVATWPGRQMSIPGWYQRWTSPAFFAGNTWTVTITDTRAADADALGYVVWRVYDKATDTTALEGDVSADGTATHEVTIDVTGRLVLEVALVGGVGDWGVTVWFEVKNAAGTVLPGTLWTFESGADGEVRRAFEIQRSVFLSDAGS